MLNIAQYRQWLISLFGLSHPHSSYVRKKSKQTGNGENYETLDHMLWSCPRLEIERTSLKTEFIIAGVSRTTSIRDLLGIGSWNVLRAC
jgi:hypothetical protein